MTRKILFAALFAALLIGGAVLAADAAKERALFESAGDAMADGDYARARARLAEYVAAYPGSERAEEAGTLLIRAHLGTADFEGAIAAARRFVGLYPESPRARQAKFLMAEAFARMRGFKDAARIVREQVDFLSGDDHEKKIAGYYLELADRAFMGEEQPDEFGRPQLVKDFAAALKWYEQARAVHVEEAAADLLSYRIALCLFENGSRYPAIREWESLLKKWPDSEWADDARYHSGVALLSDARRLMPARALFRELRELHGDSEYAPLALIRLAESYRPLDVKDEEELDRGLSFLREFMELYPSHEEAEGVLFTIGLAEQKIGHYDAAIEEFGAFLAAFPDAKQAPEAQDRIAWCWFRKHDFDRAIREWKAFLGKWPNHGLWTKVQGMIAQTAFTKGSHPLQLALKAEEKDRPALFAQAEQGFKSFLMEYPVHARAAEAQVLVAEIRYHLKDYSGAIAEWKVAASKYAETNRAPAALLRIASTQEKEQNDLGAAILAYEDLVARYPRSGEAGAVKSLLAQFNKKLLEVATERVHRTDEACVVKVRTRNIESLRFRAYRVNPEEVFRNRLTLGQVEPIVVEVVTPDWSALVNTDGYEKFRLFSRDVELPLEGPGAWIVTCHDETLTATTLVVVSDLAVVVKEAPDQTLLFAVNERTGEPVPGARVMLADGHRLVAEGVTGENGVFVRDEGRPGQIRAFTEHQGHVAYTGLSVGQGASFGYSTKVYLFTDRPLYRPGQEVELKGICRRVVNGAYVTRAGEELTLSVRDSRGTVVFEEKVKTNDYGTFSAKLFLNPSAAIGDYSIIAALKDRQTFTGAFAVKEYKKPEFTITARTDRRTYLPGDEVRMKVALRYFFGGAVPNTIVRYQMVRGSFAFDPDEHDEFAWFTKDPERERERERREARGREVIRSGELQTDAEGNAEFVFKADDIDQDYRTIVLFEALDLNRQWVREAASVVVVKQAYFAMAKTEKKVYRPGEEISVRLTTVDAIHFPVSAAGELVVSRRAFLGDREVMTAMSRQKITTGEDGKAVVKVKVDRPGEVHLGFVGEDRGENPVRGGVVVTIAGESEDLSKHAKLVASRQIYREGEVAEVLVNSPVAPVWALLTFEGERVLDHRVVRLTERSTTLRLLMKPIYSPNVFLKVAIPSDHQLHQAQDEIFVFKYLEVSVTPEQDEAKPGEKVGFTIRTSDQRGQPVKAEVSFALVDRAVLALEPDRTEQIKPFFYDQRRTLAVVTGSSHDFKYHGSTRPTNQDLLSEDLRKKGAVAFNRTMKYLHNAKEFLARDDLESAAIELRKALKVTPGHFGAQILLDDIRVALVLKRERDFLRIGAMAKALKDSAEKLESEEARNWSHDARRSPEKSGGRMMDREEMQSGRPNARPSADSPAPAPSELSKGAGPGQGYADKAPTTPAMVTPPKTAAPGNGAPMLGDIPVLGGFFDRGMAVPAALRQRFADSAAFEPHVLTDANGQARVEVDLPDNLTTWQATVRGVTKGALVGEAGNRLVVRKDLLVRVDTPRFLTQTDRVTITGTIHNNLSEAAEVTFDLKASDHLTVLNGATAMARIGAGRIRPYDIELEAPGQGLSKITATALTTIESDAAQTGLPILPRGLRTLIGRSGEVTDEAMEVFTLPDGIIPGTRDLVIRLSPGLHDSMLESVGYLSAFPYGCLEQTVNRFLPAIALKQSLHRIGSPNARLTKGLDEAVEQGLLSLYSFQNSDGSFGWFSGSVRRVSSDGKAPPARGDEMMTALAVLGMERARVAGYRVSEAHRRNALAAGQRLATAAQDHAKKAFLLYALSTAGAARLEDLNQVYRYRDSLPSHALASLALAMLETKRQYNAITLLEILATRAVSKDGLVHFVDPEKNGSVNEVETAAMAIRAFLAGKPEDPTIAGAVRWLMAMRRGPRWTSTRDTGAAVLAIADYLARESIERSDYTLEVYLGDGAEPYQRIHVAGGRIADDQSRTILVDGARLVTGRNQIKFVKRGPGRLYYTMLLNYVTEARDIMPAGNQLALSRSYVEYISPAAAKAGQAEIKPGFTIVRPDARPKKKSAPTIGRAGSGDKFRIRVEIVARDELSYVIVEDPLPAGVEVVEGQATGPFDWQERRDEKQVFFLTDVPKGTTTLTYLVQAIHPGRFTAMPTFAYPMYEPEIWGRSGEQSLTVVPESGVIGRPVTSEGITPDEIYQIAVNDFNADRFDEARKALSRLLVEFKLLDKVREECQAMLMRAAFALSDDRGAVTAYEELIQLNPRRGPKTTDERQRLANAYQGIAEYERALSLLKGVTGEFFTRDLAVAETYRAIKNPWRAQDYTAAVLAGYPDINATVEEAYRQAIRYVDLRQPADQKHEVPTMGVDTGLMLPEALLACRSFLATYPDSPLADDVAKRIVNVLSRMERYEEAVAYAEKFIRRYQDSAYRDDVYYYLAETFFNEGKDYDKVFETGRQILNQRFRLRPGRPETGESPYVPQVQYLFGKIHHLKGELGQAVAYYQRVAGHFEDARDALAFLTREELRIPETAAFPVGATPSLKVERKNLTSLDLRIYPVDLMLLIAVKKDLRAAHEIDLTGIATKVRSELTFKDGRDFRWHEDLVPIEKIREKGVYLVVAKGNGKAATSIVLVSDLDVSVQQVGDKVRVYAVHRETKEPMRDVFIKVSDGNAITSQGFTDARGVFEGQSGSGSVMVVAEKDGHFALHRR
jgi:alpha-2-macroglobulin